MGYRTFKLRSTVMDWLYQFSAPESSLVCRVTVNVFTIVLFCVGVWVWMYSVCVYTFFRLIHTHTHTRTR